MREESVGLTLDDIEDRVAGGMASGFQLEHFVIGQNGLTTWGKLKQTMREIAARVNAAVSDATVDIDQQGAYFNARQDARNAEIAWLRNRAEDFHAQLVHENGPLCDVVIERLETEFYVTKLVLQALMEKATSGVVSAGVLEAIVVLPAEITRLALETLSRPATADACIEAVVTGSAQRTIHNELPRLLIEGFNNAESVSEHSRIS